MSLSECKQKVTHREYLAWLSWLDDQYSVPSRTDFYLMQLTSVLAQVNSKNPKKIKISDFTLKFPTKQELKATETKKKDDAEASKKGWFSRLSIRRNN